MGLYRSVLAKCITCRSLLSLPPDLVWKERNGSSQGTLIYRIFVVLQDVPQRNDYGQRSRDVRRYEYRKQGPYRHGQDEQET